MLTQRCSDIGADNQSCAMAGRYIIFMVSLMLMLPVCPQRVSACTAVIVSGKVTADGKPLMWKNRDTDRLDNSIRHFRGEKYSFVGLVNSESDGGEVWIGANTAGFAIMNTASYCLKNDDVPASEMDREGVLMYRALEICATLEDFENFLDTLGRPMGVEANFGCVDAFGGAAWYETDNYTYFKRDVNEDEDGFITVTNFSVSGPVSKWKGWERFITADAVFHEMKDHGTLSSIGPLGIIDSLSRSYRHDIMGIDLVKDADEFTGKTRACVPDQDFIPRRSTSAAVAVQGVPAGGNPAETIVWAALGYPAVSVTVPVPVSENDHVPEALSSYPESGRNSFCGLARMLSEEYVFYPCNGISSHDRYVGLRFVLADTPFSTSTLSCCRRAEAAVKAEFMPLYERFVSGGISEEAYLKEYDRISGEFFSMYENAFECYIHWKGPFVESF